MEPKYNKSERINRSERKKQKDNIYNSKHVRIVLNNTNKSLSLQTLDINKPTNTDKSKNKKK